MPLPPEDELPPTGDDPLMRERYPAQHPEGQDPQRTVDHNPIKSRSSKEEEEKVLKRELIKELEKKGYKDVEFAGGGGKALVFKSGHPEYPGNVAIKVMRENAFNDSAVSRFYREIEAVANLQHPNIVTIRDGPAPVLDRFFFTMEYVEGATLSKLIADNHPRNPAHSAAFVRIIALAMDYAHHSKTKLVHRDLKPGNILMGLCSDKEISALADSPEGLLQVNTHIWGIPKIADFGEAKLIDGRETITQGRELVGTPRLVGTPLYMAPEQVKGKEDVGPAADIWALGVILYQLLTGTLPYKGKGEVCDILTQINSDDELPLNVSPRAIVRTVPYDLETICLKCLRKDPEERYESAGKLANDLRAFLRGEQIEARRRNPLDRSWKLIKRHPFIVLIIVFAVIATIPTGFLGWREYKHRLVRQKQDAIQIGQQLRVENAFKDLTELTFEKPQRPQKLLEFSEQLKKELNPGSDNPREALLARIVAVQLGQSYFLIGRNEEAIAELSSAIDLLKSSQSIQSEKAILYRGILYIAYTTRATLYDKLARERLPLIPSQKGVQLEGVDLGAIYLARAVADLENAIRGASRSSDADPPVEYLQVYIPKEKADEVRNLDLARVRPYLSLFPQVNKLDKAVAIADILDQCPTLGAGEPHYDVASVYAIAYAKHPDREQFAAAAIRHLVRANECGFGKVQIQVLAGKLPRKTLKESIASDGDFTGMANHPGLADFIAKLGQTSNLEK